MHFTGFVGTSAWAGVYVTQVCFYTNVHEQIELQAKLLNYFLGSNKSNINQSSATHSLQVVRICVYVYKCVYACICIWMRMCVYDVA